MNLNGRKALLVVGSAGSLDDGELLLKQVLEEHGMTVTVADATGPAAMATGQNVVIATDQADAATFAATFATVAVPMIAFSNSHFVSLGWIGKNAKGTVNTSVQLAIVDASTPLSSDFKAGQTFAAVLSSTSASFYWGTPTGTAIQVASVMGAPTQMVAFGYEAGASTGTATVPARRVGLGLKTNVIQNLTVDGFKLLEAALDWTAGRAERRPPARPRRRRRITAGCAAGPATRHSARTRPRRLARAHPCRPALDPRCPAATVRMIRQNLEQSRRLPHAEGTRRRTPTASSWPALPVRGRMQGPLLEGCQRVSRREGSFPQRRRHHFTGATMLSISPSFDCAFHCGAASIKWNEAQIETGMACTRHPRPTILTK